MSTLVPWFAALPWLLALGVVAWLVCSLRRNAGLVDIFWPLFLLLAAGVFLQARETHGWRSFVIAALTTAWALRLSVHLAVRNWNAPEDHRYQVIRARNEPGFLWKSLYLVFGLQTVLAFVVSAPLYAAITTPVAAVAWSDVAGITLVVAGIVFETVADAQLTRFRAASAGRGQVLQQGLWRYSRHPNYFGEFCVWWGFFLLALADGAWWSVISPLLMSVLLLRVSGVTLLEKNMDARRPGYAQYIRRTNAFFPGPRKSS
jgi:steroid 5-alpha reductase family enzyme